MTSELKLTVNGKDRLISVSGTATLAAVLSALELVADRIAVELNGRIASRKGWGDTEVHSGDRLEIVHFVGGGSLE